MLGRIPIPLLYSNIFSNTYFCVAEGFGDTIKETHLQRGECEWTGRSRRCRRPGVYRRGGRTTIDHDDAEEEEGRYRRHRRRIPDRGVVLGWVSFVFGTLSGWEFYKSDDMMGWRSVVYCVVVSSIPSLSSSSLLIAVKASTAIGNGQLDLLSTFSLEYGSTRYCTRSIFVCLVQTYSA